MKVNADIVGDERRPVERHCSLTSVMDAFTETQTGTSFTHEALLQISALLYVGHCFSGFQMMPKPSVYTGQVCCLQTVYCIHLFKVTAER